MASSKYLTSWLEPPYHTRGLDPLGIQVPAINIYGQLLPGITNVTDRARYYSFYPWIIRAFEQGATEKNLEALKEWVRRSDCVFTMIGVRHGQQSEDNNYNLHAKALTGSNTLANVVQNLEDHSEVNYAIFAELEDNSKRYFKNQLGGLGQYYLGTFDGLGLMTRKGVTVANTIEIGVPIAEALDSYVNGDLFVQTIKSGKVTGKVLDELVGFCPCQLTLSSKEHSALLDLFFARKLFESESGRQRRSTLGLILNLIQTLKDQEDEEGQFGQDVFRACVYTGALPDGSQWELPIGLETTRKKWKVYQTHELFSAAVQSIFWVALRMMEESNESFWSTKEFVKWFSKQFITMEAANILKRQSFSIALEHMRNSLPDLQDWLHDNHEIRLARFALNDCDENHPGEYSSILVNAGRILLALLARNDMEAASYVPLHFPEDFFQTYPLNMQKSVQMSDTEWKKLAINEWLAWIAGWWGIEAHFRVALRKLRFQNKDTLHIVPTDNGFVVQEMPSPTYTTPRFTQSIQILEDLGAIALEGKKNIVLTPLGETLRKETHV